MQAEPGSGSGSEAPPQAVSTGLRIGGLDAPSGWSRREEVDGSVVLVPPAGGRAAGAELRAEARRVRPAATLPDLARSHAGELAEPLRDVRLLDAGPCALGDHDAHRVLLSHRADGRDVTIQQWAIPAGPVLVTLTAAAPTLAYATLRREFAELVDGVELHAGA